VPAAIAAALCQLREAHPSWGARKLRDALVRAQPTVPWPVPSTITTLLKRAGLVPPRRRAPRDHTAWATGLTEPHAPNDVWTADFKGEFRLTSGRYCYPLTIADLHSRYVLRVRALASTASDPAAAVFHDCFAEFGLPRILRTDNGPPFSVPIALGGLSTLAVWWIRLGIRPERIAKGVPQQNGVHERMHRTLGGEAIRPPSASPAAQQTRFDRWGQTFNHERPHEALHGDTPAMHYTASPRPLPTRVPMLEYPPTAHLRRVSPTGVVSWRDQPVFLSAVLRGEYVGFEETADREWTIQFGPLRLGIYSEEFLAFTERVTWIPA
jgi:transposase InsO family protein